MWKFGKLSGMEWREESMSISKSGLTKDDFIAMLVDEIEFTENQIEVLYDRLFELREMLNQDQA